MQTITKTWRITSQLQSVMADLRGVKGVAMCDPNSDHASQYCAHSQGIQCGGAKLEHAEFCTVGIKVQWRNIYISEQYVWRSDSMVGEKTTVVYGRTVRNRDEENFIHIFPVFMKSTILSLNKKYNKILTKPAPAPYCTQIRFLAKRA